ncbi:BURP domain-containing protein BNM2A-like [Magnolia sinica]|uniref:BURP domain-containing protein BNM2A-like n=1 Tax=Magnolia sinica TaxID=86752 RepID=UPI002658DB3E|nr:BURP domain-containing protein BNM2A-like [Magnolia sinica]
MAIHGHEQLHIMDVDVKHDHDQPSPHVDHMDHPSLNVFFKIEDLEMRGKEMLIYFPNRDFSSSTPFFPKEKANTIPFSSTQLPFLLEMFSFRKDSPQAQAMQDTLRQCGLPPIKGEKKISATSLESMLDFTRAIFGMGSHFQILATAHCKKSTPTSQNPLLQKYIILEVPQEISAPSMVACQTMPYPYVVFYCHQHVSKSKVFIVSLEGEDGDKVDAVAVCHLDTSDWAHNHVSFRVLGIKPGTVPVCHFFPEDHLVLVPTLASI